MYFVISRTRPTVSSVDYVSRYIYARNDKTKIITILFDKSAQATKYIVIKLTKCRRPYYSLRPNAIVLYHCVRTKHVKPFLNLFFFFLNKVDLNTKYYKNTKTCSEHYGRQPVNRKWKYSGNGGVKPFIFFFF